eukprot:g2482.t1
MIKLEAMRKVLAEENASRGIDTSTKCFVDDSFAANWNSIGNVEQKQVLSAEKAVWKRIVEIPCRKVKNKEGACTHMIFNNIIKPTEIRQGMLGNCYFLAALAALCEHPKFIRQLFLKTTGISDENVQKLLHDQDITFLQSQKQGKILPASGESCNDHGTHFYDHLKGEIVIRFCVSGIWTDVTVDDRFLCIPSIEGGEPNCPAFSRSVSSEIWVMTVEKAYAKLHGSYSKIENGSAADALFDLTGCPPFRLMIDKNDPAFSIENTWNALKEKVEEGCAFTVSIPLLVDPGTGLEKAGDEHESGLVHGHSYTLLSIHEVLRYRKNVKLLRLRNPWARGEWNGDWSDGWRGWTKDLKEQVGMVDEDDGVFFMAFDDVVKNFDCFEGVVLGPKTGQPWHHSAEVLQFGSSGSSCSSTAIAFTIEVTKAADGGDDVTTYVMLGQVDNFVESKYRPDGSNSKQEKYEEYTPLQACIYRLGNLDDSKDFTVVSTPMFAGLRTVLVGERSEALSLPTPLQLSPGKYLCVCERALDGINGQSEVNTDLSALTVIASACSCTEIKLTPQKLLTGPLGSSVPYGLGQGDSISRIILDDLMRLTLKHGTQTVLCDQTDPKFVKKDWNLNEFVCILFSGESNAAGAPNGVLSVEMNISGTNLCVHAPEEAEVTPGTGDVAMTLKFNIHKASATRDGFILIKRKAPGVFAYGVNFSLGITAGG